MMLRLAVFFARVKIPSMPFMGHCNSLSFRVHNFSRRILVLALATFRFYATYEMRRFLLSNKEYVTQSTVLILTRKCSNPRNDPTVLVQRITDFGRSHSKTSASVFLFK